MKKIYRICALLVCLILGSNLYGFINQRQAWWENRLKSLKNEIISLRKNLSTDPAILNLVENDISRAEQMIAFFNSDGKAPSSVIGDNEPVSPDELKTRCRQITDAVFSLYLLDYLTSSTGERENYRQTRSAMEKILGGLLKKELGQGDDILTGTIINEDISKVQMQYITMESFVYSIMRNRHDLLTQIRTTVENDIIETHEISGLKPMKSRLAVLITEKAIARCNAMDPRKTMTITTDDVSRSRSWIDISGRLSANLRRFRQVCDMVDANRALSPSQIRYYYKRPDELDDAIFKDSVLRYFDRRSIGQTSFDRSRPEGDRYTMNIPRNPDGIAMFGEMDELRKSIIPVITGREDGGFFEKTRARFNEILARHLHETMEGFSREEETVRALKEKNPASVILNEDQFLKARAIFNGRADLARGYADKSLQFIKRISEARSRNADAVVASYEKRLQMQADFISLAVTLVENAAAVAPLENTSLHKSYALSLRRTGNIFRSLGYNIGVEKEIIPFMERRHHQEIRDKRDNFTARMKQAKNEISRFHAVYLKNRNKYTHRKNTEEKSLLISIANMEIDLIAAAVKEYTAVYDRCTYSDRVFKEYGVIFRQLQDELNSATLSMKLERVLSARSLFPLLENFSPGRMQVEASARTYLKRSIATDLARLVTLVNFYRQRGIDISGAPDNEYLEAVRKKISSNPVVSIATWGMTDSNFRDIDRNVVKLLFHRKNRIAWNNRNQDAAAKNGNSEARINLYGGQAVFSIPPGWNKKAGTPRHAALESQDRDASIIIRGDNPGGKNPQEQCLMLVQDSNGTVIKQRWGKKGTQDYFWALCRLPHKRVMEVYIIRNGKYSVAVSGSTDSDKYRYFKPKLDMVFNSLVFTDVEKDDGRHLSRKE